MKFTINAGEFARALKPSLEIATKNTKKEFNAANKITIDANEDGIIFSAYGGTASIVSNISDKYFGDINYKCVEEGSATVDAVIMMDSLLVFSSSDVNVSFSSGQLIISLIDDEDIVQPVTTFDESVNVPKVAENFIKEVIINREILIEGINKVSFAIAFEERQRNYMCLILESSKNKFRFAAGSNSRFAISDTKGENIGNKSKTQIIFPKYNISNINKILYDASDKNIIIKYAEADVKDGSPEQIVLEFSESGINLCIFAIDPSIKYPNLDAIINFDYPNKIYCDIKDWNMTVAGISATMHIDSDIIHNTEVTANTEKEFLKVETKTLLKAKNKVKFTDDKKCMTNNPAPWFRCNSLYLKEMVSKANKDGEIAIYFENQEKLEDLPDDEKRMKPILIKFSDNANNPRNTVENFYMFFSCSTK